MSFLKNKTILFIAISVLFSLASVFFSSLYLSILTIALLLSAGFFAFLTEHKFQILNREFDVKTRGFSSLTESLSDGVLIYDPDFTVLSMNSALEKLFNVERKNYVGKRLQPKIGAAGASLEGAFIQCVFPSLAPSSSQISEPSAWPQIVEISTENPQRKFETTLSKVVDDNGEASYFIKSVRDATRERDVSKSKNEFINVAAHQLRTPLTSLNWALESIAKDAVENPKMASETASEALRTSERALKIVNDLLEVAKMDEGVEKLSMQKTEVAEFLRGIVSLTNQFAKERSVSLYFAPIPPEWEGVSALIDKDQLGAACANLIENAIKYNTKQGEVSVMLEVFPERKVLKVSVKDTGVGVSEKDKEFIFGKFFRGGNVVTLDPDGSGLGLYIVKNIIERHGGRIGFESRENRGSTFWFTLPISTSGGNDR